MRNMVESLILQLIERFGDSTTQAVMIVAEKFMMNYNEAHTSNIIQSSYEKIDELKWVQISQKISSWSLWKELVSIAPWQRTYGRNEKLDSSYSLLGSLSNIISLPILDPIFEILYNLQRRLKWYLKEIDVIKLSCWNLKNTFLRFLLFTYLFYSFWKKQKKIYYSAYMHYFLNPSIDDFWCRVNIVASIIGG